MTPEEQEALQYRFSGYQLNTLQLDETGPSFLVLQEPHPYYRNQPLYWQKPAYKGNTLGTTEIVGGDVKIESSGNANSANPGNGNIDLMDL